MMMKKMTMTTKEILIIQICTQMKLLKNLKIMKIMITIK